MGSGTFDASAYARTASTMRGKATEEIYTSKTIENKLDPKGVKIRESRDSTDNPASTPIIVGLDVTGSMGIIADNIARTGLGTLFNGILDRKPVSNPHIMFAGIGDMNYDRAPLQVSQFEADNRIVEQLTQIYLEHGGGGNSFESYNGLWYFASFHTAHDAFEKRGKKGYLFTIGDEEVPKPITRDQIKKFIGDDIQADLSSEDLLQLASRTYEVYHVVIEQGDHARRFPDRVRDSWTALMGQRVIFLSDYTKLAETIVSAIEVAEGRDAHESASAWGAGAAAVHDAVKALPRSTTANKLLGHSAS